MVMDRTWARRLGVVGRVALRLSVLKKERERIYKAGSTVNVEGRIDGNLNLSRAIGDIAHKKNTRIKLEEQAITSLPDIKIHEISGKTDFALLACDGIWETKTSQQIVDYVYI